MEINYRQCQYSSQNPGVRALLRTTSGLNMDDQRDAQNNFCQTVLRTTEVKTFLQFWRGSKRVPWSWRWRWRVRPLESRKQLTTFCNTFIFRFKYFSWANRTSVHGQLPPEQNLWTKCLCWRDSTDFTSSDFISSREIKTVILNLNLDQVLAGLTWDQLLDLGPVSPDYWFGPWLWIGSWVMAWDLGLDKGMGTYAPAGT